VEDSRSPRSHQIVQRSRGVTESILQVQAWEKSDHGIQVKNGPWITHVNLISGFCELKGRNLCIKTRKVRSLEIEKESEPSGWKDTCHKILSIVDLGIGGQRGKSFEFTSGEVVRRTQPSIGGGQVVEI
jgi:hypothetical protein